MKIETFDDVLDSISKNPNRTFSLLLGNGFSVAYDPNIFSYNALHDFVTKLEDKDLAAILRAIETPNFEVVLQYLNHFSSLLDVLEADPTLKERVDAAGTKLKTSFLAAVKALHPEHVFVMPEERSQACAAFLKRFLDTGGGIYSTNYDLLLYWVLMRNGLAAHKDGFGRECPNPHDGYIHPEDHEKPSLTWGKNREEPNIFYLHGALHLFDSGTAIIKEESDTKRYMLEKINARIESGEYPIFVTAGNKQQKLRHITHNQYLNFCYDSLCHAKGSLVTFGFAFGSSDEHIIEAINRAAKQGIKTNDKLWSIYIGAFSDSDREHIESIKDKFKCEVHLYEAKSENIWGSTS